MTDWRDQLAAKADSLLAAGKSEAEVRRWLRQQLALHQAVSSESTDQTTIRNPNAFTPTDIARLFVHGATLGLSDPAAAAIQSLGPSTFGEALRGQHAATAEARGHGGLIPSLLTEGAGGLVTGGILGKLLPGAAGAEAAGGGGVLNAVKQGAKVGGLVGGISGASSADTPLGAVGSGIIGSLFGGTLGGGSAALGSGAESIAARIGQGGTAATRLAQQEASRRAAEIASAGGDTPASFAVKIGATSPDATVAGVPAAQTLGAAESLSGARRAPVNVLDQQLGEALSKADKARFGPLWSRFPKPIQAAAVDFTYVMHDNPTLASFLMQKARQAPRPLFIRIGTPQNQQFVPTLEGLHIAASELGRAGRRAATSVEGNPFLPSLITDQRANLLGSIANTPAGTAYEAARTASAYQRVSQEAAQEGRQFLSGAGNQSAEDVAARIQELSTGPKANPEALAQFRKTQLDALWNEMKDGGVGQLLNNPDAQARLNLLFPNADARTQFLGVARSAASQQGAMAKASGSKLADLAGPVHADVNAYDVKRAASGSVAYPLAHKLFGGFSRATERNINEPAAEMLAGLLRQPAGPSSAAQYTDLVDILAELRRQRAASAAVQAGGLVGGIGPPASGLLGRP